MKSVKATAQPAQLRIAFINSDLWIGGGTVFLLSLAGELVRRKVPAHVFTLAETNSLATDFERLNIPVSVEHRHGSIFEDRIESLLKKMARFAPNTVVASMNADAGEVLRHLPPGVLRVGVIHAICQLEMAAPYAAEMDCLVTVSDYVRDLIAKRPEFSHLPIHSVDLGFPIPGTVGRPSLISARPLNILYLGRLEESAKRVRLFPKILDGLKASEIPFAWTIAGEGPEKEMLQSQLTTGSPNQQVKFTGVVPYSDVPDLLARHDILLLTSDTETFSLSLHEAMAAGVVPVTSDLEGPIRNIVSLGAGILVPPDHVKGYSDAIVWLHEHRAEMEKMSVTARALIESKYSVEAMSDRWIALLSPAAKNRTRWPDCWDIKPPIHVSRSLWFSKPARILRRIAAKVACLCKQDHP